jgi:hypothetical protein
VLSWYKNFQFVSEALSACVKQKDETANSDLFHAFVFPHDGKSRILPTLTSSFSLLFLPKNTPSQALSGASLRKS